MDFSDPETVFWVDSGSKIGFKAKDAFSGIKLAQTLDSRAVSTLKKPILVLSNPKPLTNPCAIVWQYVVIDSLTTSPFSSFVLTIVINSLCIIIIIRAHSPETMECNRETTSFEIRHFLFGGTIFNDWEGGGRRRWCRNRNRRVNSKKENVGKVHFPKRYHRTVNWSKRNPIKDMVICKR